MNKKRIRKKNIKGRVAQAVLVLVIIGFLFLMLYPLMMALWNAFKSSAQYDYSQFYPTVPLRWQNLRTAFKAIWRFAANTVYIALIVVPLSRLFSTMAAYAFAKLEWPGRKLLFSIVMVLIMIPSILTLIPSFVLYRDMGLLNSHWALILALLSGGTIGDIFLLNAFFRGIPHDVFESARVDGANEVQCYIHLVIPLSMPIICVQIVNQLFYIWNDYLWPMITITDYKKLTLSPGLVLSFSTEYASNMPVSFAGYLLASIPLIIVFIFGNKTYIRGMMNSGIKM